MAAARSGDASGCKRRPLPGSPASDFPFFVILDGVFLEQLAVSPREVIDVIQDGSVVAGASSMGAIRAAECWPAGMRGVGSIYRMYRRGCLKSDDEVAVAFSPIPPTLSATVPLVNVRYAVSRAVRQGTLTATEAIRVVQSGSELHYADRTWESILQAAGIADRDTRLLESLKTHDLKKMDAIRAVARVRAWIETSPQLLQERSVTSRRPSFVRPPREASHGSPGQNERNVRREDLWRWLVASGRYRRYASPPATMFDGSASHGGRPRSANPGRHSPPEVTARTRDSVWTSHLGIAANDVASAFARHQAWSQLLGELASHDTAFARAVWADIVVAGDVDAIVLRFIAFSRAVDWARAHSLQPDARQRCLALTEIAHRHGSATWSELQAALAGHGEVWSWIRAPRRRSGTGETCSARVLRWYSRDERSVPSPRRPVRPPA